MSLQIQLDPLSAGVTLLSPFLQVGLDRLISTHGGRNRSSSDDYLNELSLTVAKIEQILDNVEYEQLLNSSKLAMIRRLKYASYQAEDNLDEILICRSEELGQPTQSTYNQVSSYFSSSANINQESLNIMSSESLNSLSSRSHSSMEMCPSSWQKYRQLPAPLKRCFVLFSIFPKNHKYQKENLVQLWMAEDFIRDDGKNLKLEDIGSSYFDKLVEESFFSEDDISQIKGDLHELAKFVSCGECLTISEAESIADFLSRLRDSLRHLSLCCETYSREMADLLTGCEGLRTFLLNIGGKRGNIHQCPKVKVPYNQFACLKRLRVLDISCPSIIEVPDSIGCLKHLRYLDLSKSRIQKLPKTISKLHSLQILKLNGCRNLKNLPSLEHLRSLKHLLLDKNHHLVSLPPGIGKLTMLETFSCPFVVGKKGGENIGVLKKMNNLRGSLCISNLENVLKLEEAKEAALNEKQFLRQLKLKWSEESIGQYRFEQVLEGLKPHSNLETLKIVGYGGASFPHEMANDFFGKLKKVSLKNCKNCPYLPALWRLPVLKTLSIRGIDKMKQLNNDSFLGSATGVGLPSLEILKVEDMPNLKSCNWCSFPMLNQLMFKDCPMLEEIEELQMLASQCLLKIKECPLLIRWIDRQPCWQKKEQDDDGSWIYR